MPIDEMIDAMIPVYQKHFTKGNIDDHARFLRDTNGAKTSLRNTPQWLTEAMQAVMPIVAENDG